MSSEVKTVSLDNLADLRALDQDSFPNPGLVLYGRTPVLIDLFGSL